MSPTWGHVDRVCTSITIRHRDDKWPTIRQRLAERVGQGVVGPPWGGAS